MCIQVKTLASGSSGNCYVLHKDGSDKDLMLEAGIPIKQILKGISYKPDSIAACLVTHEHGDHARSVGAVMDYGIMVVASPGTFEALGKAGQNIRAQKLSNRTPLAMTGGWTVSGYPAIHDAAEPFIYLIRNGSDVLLFATDTAYIPYHFRGLTQMMVEANYDLDIMKDRIIDGSVHSARKKRTMDTHMEIGTLEAWLRDLNRDGSLDKLREIRLIHTSAANSDPEAFRKRLETVTGIPVYVEGGK